MDERRNESRLMCAELVEVIWKDKSGRQRRTVANLEDISQTGACLQMESSVVRDTPISIRYGDGELVGDVRYCMYRDLGYFVGVVFSEGCRWSRKHFRPQHLLDPKQLVSDAMNRSRHRGRAVVQPIRPE